MLVTMIFVWGLFFLGLAVSRQAHAQKQETAIFAGGCFWCMEPAYRQLPGLLSVEVGYTGGDTTDPTYEEVSTGATGHVEAIRIVFDPDVVDYSRLLDLFWRQIDPTDPGGQFADRGSQYATYIFHTTAEQQRKAEASKAGLEGSGKFAGKPLATKIVAAKPFYPAEDYHQRYYLKRPLQYQLYKFGSGRESYLDKTWGREE